MFKKTGNFFVKALGLLGMPARCSPSYDHTQSQVQMIPITPKLTNNKSPSLPMHTHFKQSKCKHLTNHRKPKCRNECMKFVFGFPPVAIITRFATIDLNHTDETNHANNQTHTICLSFTSYNNTLIQQNKLFSKKTGNVQSALCRHLKFHFLRCIYNDSVHNNTFI